MIEIVEMLRLWLQGLGLREVARLSGTDRKTVRRYVDRTRACGLDREGGQLTDEMLAAVIAGVRPSRPNGKSQAWETIDAQAEQITAWLKQGLTLTKVHTLLGRRGVVVSYRTLHRYATKELGFGQRQATVPVADCEPGSELQVDFGRLGLHTDAEDGRRRVVHGLIFTAVHSRRCRSATPSRPPSPPSPPPDRRGVRADPAEGVPDPCRKALTPTPPTRS